MIAIVRHNRRTALVLVALLIMQLGACAPATQRPTATEAEIKGEARKQKIIAAQTYVENFTRADLIAEKIRLASPQLCPNRNFSTGAVLFSPISFSKEWRPAFHGAGYKDGWTVVAVARGTPAELAGMQPGDFIVKVNGLVSTGDKDRSEDIYRKLREDGVRSVTVQRGSELRELMVGAIPSCNYPLDIEVDDTANAHADGKSIHISSGIMRLIPSEVGLALVIGHEIAHNTRKHVQTMQTNAAVGAVLGAAFQIFLGAPNAVNAGASVGASAYSQSFESEADYVGLYLIARAGYNVNEAPDVWRRMGASHPGTISHGSSHPPAAERFVNLEAAAKEIEAKRAAGLPLIPNEAN